MKIYAYVRVSKDTQDTENQRGEIRRYIEAHQLDHVHQWHDIDISSRRDIADRGIVALIDALGAGDLLICTELSRLGRSLSQLTSIVDQIIAKDARIVFIKNNMDINPQNRNDPQNKVMLTMFALFAELERDFISRRIKESLKTKSDNGQILGRRKGAKVGSKYDAHAGEILSLLNTHGEKWTKILTVLQTLHPKFTATRQSLAAWVDEKCEKGLGDLWRMKV